MYKYGTYYKLLKDVVGINRPFSIRAKMEVITPNIGKIVECKIKRLVNTEDDFEFTKNMFNFYESKEIGSRKFFSKCVNVRAEE